MLHPGDVLELRLPGGGGFGPPGEREPERVTADVALGYVSAAAALGDYGLALTHASSTTHSSRS